MVLHLWRSIRPIITQTNIHIHTTQFGVDILTYTPCRLPLSKRKFKQVFRSLRAPPFAFTWSTTVFRASEPIPQYLCPLVPSGSCQSSCTNLSPSLTNAVLSSTQVHHSCLPAPSSALSSPFNTLPALQHVSNLHAILVTCPLSLPLPSTFPCHPMCSLPPPRTPCRLLPEFHVPLTSAESAKDAINWYEIHFVVS